MVKKFCPWAICLTFMITACSGKQSENWIEKLQQADRNTSIKAILSELDRFQQNIDLLHPKSKAEQKPLDIDQWLMLVNLDRTSDVEGQKADPAQIVLNQIEEQLTQYQYEQKRYLRTKGAEKEQHAANKKTLLASMKASYDAATATLDKFLDSKVQNKRITYVNALVEAYGQYFNRDEEKYIAGSEKKAGMIIAPCRRAEIVDALRLIGKGWVDSKGLEEFKKTGSYKQIADVFILSLEDDLEQPPLTAISAALTLNHWKSGEYIDKYVGLIKKDKVSFVATDGVTKERPIHFDLRDALIKLLTSFATPKHKDILIKIFTTSPELQPISYIALSAKALGNMKINEDRVINRLVECLWLDDARGRSATGECRKALNQLDPKKVGSLLLKTFKRQNEKVEARAVKLNYAHTGLIEAKTAEVLGDLQYKGAGDYLIAALEQNDPNPEPFASNPEKNTFFVKGQVQKTVSIAKTLAFLGESKGSKALMKILNNEEKLFEYKLAAIQQLAYLGSDAVMRDLLKLFNKKLEPMDIGNRDLQVQHGKTVALLIRSKDRNFSKFQKAVKKKIEESTEKVAETEKQKADAETKKKELEESLEKTLKPDILKLKKADVEVPEPPKVPDMEKKKDEKKKDYAKRVEELRKEFQKTAEAYEKKLTEDQKKLRKLEFNLKTTKRGIKKIKGLLLEVDRMTAIYKAWQKDYTMMSEQLKVIKSCRSNTSSWVSKLSDSSIDIRSLAAYTLARKEATTSLAGPALIKGMMDKDPVVRDIVLFGLTRHANDKKYLDDYKTAHKAYTDRLNKGDQDPSLRGTIYTLDLLIAQLSR
jgi:hypothetical protein